MIPPRAVWKDRKEHCVSRGVCDKCRYSLDSRKRNYPFIFCEKYNIQLIKMHNKKGVNP